ncbi:hypothetical protein ABM90_17175 [Rhodococcus erythropolis]|nr:hypothetical protein ABM90_17175 [Rhodococcus erythropolis]
MVSSVREDAHSLLSGESGRAQFAYIGALRPDKGADVLVEVCRLFSRPYHLTLVGCSEVPEDLWIAVQESAVGTVEAVHFPVSDSDLVSHISRADLILAPYIEPTQSGSLILALTVGATAIAFEGGAIGELLPDRQLIGRGDSAEFAKRAFEVLDQGGSSWRVSAVQLDADCWRSWLKILDQ